MICFSEKGILRFNPTVCYSNEQAWKTDWWENVLSLYACHWPYFLTAAIKPRSNLKIFHLASIWVLSWWESDHSSIYLNPANDEVYFRGRWQHFYWRKLRWWSKNSSFFTRRVSPERDNRCKLRYLQGGKRPFAIRSTTTAHFKAL